MSRQSGRSDHLNHLSSGITDSLSDAEHVNCLTFSGHDR